MLTPLCFALMLLTAQGSPPAQAQRPGQPQPPSPNASTDVKGTALIKGRVVSAVTGKPLRRAQIRLSAPELGQPRTTSTDIDGEYELAEVPAGRYTVSVTRSGYITLQYGQRRSNEPGKPLEISDAERLDKIDFSLQRAGVITGRVTDETGDTVAGATVWAMQPQFFQGRRRLVPISPPTHADDVGQFRLLGLPPGEYVVMATLRETWTIDGPDKQKQTLGYTPSYFPGTANAAEAQRVKVGLSQQVGPIEFGLVPIKTANVSGTAVGSDGLPLAGSTVMLSQEVMGPGGGIMSMAGNSRVAPDGTWTLRNVPGGEYQLQVASVDRERPGEMASLTLQVQGVDLEGVALVADGGGTLAGQVVTDDGSPLPEAASPIRVYARRIASGMSSGSRRGPENNGVIAADGRFTLEAVAGGSLIRLLGLPAGWALKAIEISGRDYADGPLELRGGQRTTGARLIISRSLPSISGHITDEKDAGVDASVLLFAADASKWTEGSGALRTARPGKSGLFRFDAVRPGDYLVVAVENIEQWQANDPEFLEELRDRATKVTVDTGRSEVVTLRVKRQLPAPNSQPPRLGIGRWELGVVSLVLLASPQVSVQPQQPQRPRRDIVAPQKGTAILRGHVVAADTERPLRRVRVRISAPELSEPKTASTNLEGAYEVRDLPAGRYTIQVSRGGYLPLQYGQRRPGEPGKPLQLADGETVDAIDFRLPRAGAITGQILDETGEPVSGVTVAAMQVQFFRGRRRLVPVSDITNTDDTGQYRVGALSPGDYVIMALFRESWVSKDRDRQVLGYATTYFPGTASAAEAQRVKVAVGQEVAAIDFALVPGRAATVSGTALRSDGAPLAGATVSLDQYIRGPVSSMASSVSGTKVAADGSWTIRNVPPGEYELEATATDRERGTERATTILFMQGTDVEGITLTTGAAGTLSGHVVTDDGQPLPTSVTRLRVVPDPITPDRQAPMIVMGDDNGLVGADGAFTFKGLLGPSILRVWLPAGWAVKSIEIGGTDYAQTPLDVRGGQHVAGARIVITKRFPTIAGRITDDKGKPANGTVLLFPSDASKWFTAADTLRSARPDQSGNFRLETVRPGQYLAIALDYVQTWQLNDPEFLEELRDRATKLTVAEESIGELNLTVKK